MKRNITVIAFFIVLLLAVVGGPLLSNLMSNDVVGPEPTIYQHTEYYNDSYQYNGIMGMGHSN